MSSAAIAIARGRPSRNASSTSRPPPNCGRTKRTATACRPMTSSISEIEDVIGRQAVAVLLVRPQFGGGRLVDDALRDGRPLAIAIAAELIDGYLIDVLQDGKAAGHVPVK